jgi:hypothetical protein
VKLEDCNGQPMHVDARNVVAFGRIDYDGTPSLKSWLLLKDLPHRWELKTPYEQLQSAIAGEILKTDGANDRSGIEYL